MKVIIAIDSFKGCMTSVEANRAAAEGIRCVCPDGEIVQVPVCLIAGRISDREQLMKAGFARVECINPPGITLEEAMRKEVAIQHVKDTVMYRELIIL